jgi:hypothetical protein
VTEKIGNDADLSIARPLGLDFGLDVRLSVGFGSREDAPQHTRDLARAGEPELDAGS